MKNFNWAFAAGETKTFYGAYSKFRIIENSAGAASSISVAFFSNSSDTDEDANSVLAGYYAAPKNGFDRIDIKNNGIAQIINFCVYDGDGGYDRATGVFSVAGTVKTQEAGTPFTTSFKSNVAINAVNGVETVFTAAANVNGIVINAAQFVSANAAVIQVGGFLVRATVPANFLDSGSILATDNTVSIAGNVNSFSKLSGSIFVPAGFGLFFISSVIEVFGLRNVVYTIL